jgi:monoamine oxidase
MLLRGCWEARAHAGAPMQAPVLIIGGGISGISAAYYLRMFGIGSIVLEGRPDRFGGRIWTSRAWPDAPVDMGASWLTHEEWSPLAQLVRKFGIKTAPSDLLNFTLSEANGRQLSELEALKLLALYTETYAKVKVLAAQRQQRKLPDIPASDGFAQVIASQRLSAQVHRQLQFFINFGIEEPNASPLKKLSLYHWDDDLVLLQLYTSVFPQGYGQVVEKLAAGLDIRLNHVVSKIDYGPRGVHIVTNRGEFQAPFGIVTLPLGVLKSKKVTFSPDLPPWKTGAIHRLGFGLSDKVYLRFPRVFWNPQADLVNRIADTPEDRWSTWINVFKYDQKPILFAFNRNEYATQLENMTNTQVIDQAMAVLRKQYGSKIPDPVGMQRSRWGNDPFSMGTIPSMPPGATPNDYNLVAAPVSGRLLFAGDGTNDLLNGLVLGAFMSGQREAIRIKNLM